MEHLAESLGHADRVSGLRGYCAGLMLPLQRKSVEPMAAGVDPLRVSARHQSLHHFVAKAGWSDEALLRRVAQWVVPQMGSLADACWVIDDTGFPKKGRHSVGVARQYCGQLGKQDNCQVAVSVSLATEDASLPVAWRLYLPQAWAEDTVRRDKAGVPQEVAFQTKNEIALAQIEQLLAEGAPRLCVLADAGYGNDKAFRNRLESLGLPYVVGVTSSVVVWPPGVRPLPPRRHTGCGRPAVIPRRTPSRQPVSLLELARALPPNAFLQVHWRDGTNHRLQTRFAAARVCPAGGNSGRARLQPEQWLLIEWPQGDAEPLKYYLSNLPAGASTEELASKAHRRWRIERDYQDLKQEFGLGHYEGRGWTGFHHHASLTIAAYGFLVAERLRGHRDDRARKNAILGPQPALPEGFTPRGSPKAHAPRV